MGKPSTTLRANELKIDAPLKNRVRIVGPCGLRHWMSADDVEGLGHVLIEIARQARTVDLPKCAYCGHSFNPIQVRNDCAMCGASIPVTPPPAYTAATGKLVMA